MKLKEKLEALSNLLDIKKYDDLEKKDYLQCGFNEDEAKKLMNIYYSICDVWVNEKGAFKGLANECLENTSDARLVFYFNYYLLKSAVKKEVYPIARYLIDLVIEHHQSIFKLDKSDLVDVRSLDQLLVYSSKMNLRPHDMLSVIYWYCYGTGEFINFSLSIAHALHKVEDEDLEAKFQELHIRSMERYLEIKGAHSLDNYIKKLENEKNPEFNGDDYKERLYLLYLELGKLRRGMIELSHLEKAVEGLKMCGSEQLKEALGELESIVNDNDIDWQHTELEMPEEYEEQLDVMKKLLQIYLDAKSFEEIVTNIHKKFFVIWNDNGKKSKPKEVYSPYPVYQDILGVEENTKRSPITELFSSSTIGDGRVVKESEEPKNKGMHYALYLDNGATPVMEHLDSDLDELIRLVEELLGNTVWLSQETKGFFSKVIRFYKEDSAFEFMHFAVVLIEKVLRDLYRRINNTQITSMKTDASAQLHVNLQDIMKDEAVKAFLGEDLYKYMEHLLVEERGYNFRNLIAHGLLNIRAFNHMNSRALLHLILVVINFSTDRMEGVTE